MARERYLVGVSEEELRPDPKPEPPKTPKGKISNYWYHYKWHTLGSLFATVVLTVMIVQMVTRPKYDYTVMMVTENYVSDQARDRILEELTKYGRDLNGDGETKISFEALHVTGDMATAQAGATKLVANLSAGDMLFFIFDEYVYENRIQTSSDERFEFFTPPDVNIEGVSAEEYYWNWKDSGLRKEPVFAGMPDNLYFGVRRTIGTAAKKQEMHTQNMELLKAFLTKTPVSE